MLGLSATAITLGSLTLYSVSSQSQAATSPGVALSFDRKMSEIGVRKH